MLLFVPTHLHGEQQTVLTRKLIDALCGRAAQQGVHLAQALLEVHDEGLQGMLIACGFGKLAELLYLQAAVGKVAEPTLPPGCNWLTYSPSRHELFASTILATYQDSFACPGLNGLRTIDDILAGHRATGDFDPEHWYEKRKSIKQFMGEVGGMLVAMWELRSREDTHTTSQLVVAPRARPVRYMV